MQSQQGVGVNSKASHLAEEGVRITLPKVPQEWESASCLLAEVEGGADWVTLREWDCRALSGALRSPWTVTETQQSSKAHAFT